VETENSLNFHCLKVELPNFIVLVTDKQVVGTLHHGHDVSWCVISLIEGDLPLNRMNFNFKDVTSFGIIDVNKFPPAGCSHHHQQL
jgi:hypothetical protein